MSESQQRQMQIFGQNPAEKIDTVMESLREKVMCLMKFQVGF
jgi:hypothetical protein